MHLDPTLIERLRSRLGRSPAQSSTRLDITHLALDEADLRLPFHSELDNGEGAIHGGILAMLADTAVACALSTNYNGRMGFATSNLNIHYLRRAKSDVVAHARIVKKGRTVCVGQVEIRSANDVLVATATCDFVLTSARDDRTAHR